MHDEVELAFGDVRLKEGGGLGGHNGLRSLEQYLGSRDFWRVRVGVGKETARRPAAGRLRPAATSASPGRRSMLWSRAPPT